MGGKIQSAERISQTDASDNYVFQRSRLAYYRAAELVSGNVLEIGTGSGYGIEIIAPRAERFLTVDKTVPPCGIVPADSNVTFRRMIVPPLEGIASNSFDFVISFQVIEHIKDDRCAIAEIYRVLKKGGKLIISTPNKSMSLTRNPWHVREYTLEEFRALLALNFDKIEQYGVDGNDKVMRYYENNRRSVEAITRFDILKLQYRLPRQILQIPYDIMNRRNRRKLLSMDNDLTASIRMSDYRVVPVHKECFDLFYIAEKE